MKTIIAGTRTIRDSAIVEKAVEDSGFAVTEVVSGCAKGVDTFGEDFARKWRIPVRKFPAAWRTNGKFDKAAGIKRNIDMGNYADALIAIWDGKSSGTEHMIRIAKVKELKIFVKEVITPEEKLLREIFGE